MFMYVAMGNLAEAFHANELTFCLLPVYLVFFIYLSVRYVRYGDIRLPRWMTVCLWILVAAYLVYGILRNIL